MSDSDWKGNHPFYLMIRHKQHDGKMVGTVVDLDEGGWSAKHKDLMRKPGRWYLVHKETRTMPLAMTVEEGEQPYYKARHVGIGSMTAEQVSQSELIAYGIGKKFRDGHVERMWYFPQGMAVMGDDVNPIGIEMLKVVNAVAMARKKPGSRSFTVDAKVNDKPT